MKLTILTLFDYVVLSSLLITTRGTAPVGSIPMKITNYAGAPIELFWINPTEQSLVLQTNKPIRNSTDSMINSYNGHIFVAKFQKDTGAETYFAKGPSEENVIITFDESSNTLKSKQVTKFHEIMDLIDDASKSSCEGLSGDLFSGCVSVRIMNEINRIVNSTKELKKYRNIMAEKLVDYMCADQANVNATQPAKSDSFFNPNDQTYTVNILSDNDRSKVWTISNWISPKECLALEENSVKVSNSAQVGGGFEISSDGSVISTTVDAKVNKVHSTYDLEQDFPDQDELWPLYTKTFQMTNKIAKYNLKTSDQKGFEITHRSASILYDNSLTCDGVCEDDAEHQPGGNVATAIMFCKVAEEGGLFLFPKSDLIVQPTVGMGVFFSYKDDKSAAMDDGYTEHVTCPVLRGEVRSAALRMAL